MSNTTVSSYTSSYVGRELSERIMKASSDSGTADGKLKTILTKSQKVYQSISGRH